MLLKKHKIIKYKDGSNFFKFRRLCDNKEDNMPATLLCDVCGNNKRFGNFCIYSSICLIANSHMKEKKESSYKCGYVL